MIIKSKTPKVYKNKKLNNANFSDFNLTDYQVFLHLITKIGGVDENGKYLQIDQLNREYTLTAQEFSKMFNCDLQNAYKIIKKACKRLMKTSLTIERVDLFETWEINVCSMAKYKDKSGKIDIQFTENIMPYLAQVKKKFVLYNLKEVSNFGSLYTTRLYELVQEFQDTGYIIKSVEQLRLLFTTGDKFKKYNDFKRFTFAHAIDEINQQYDLRLHFEELKEQKKVVAIKFMFKHTIIKECIDHKGNKRNIYIKPKSKIKTPVPKKRQRKPKQLELDLK